MKQNCWLMLLIALLLATPQLSKAVPPGSATATKEAARTQLLQAYGKLPLSFEANQGQTDNSVSFLVRGRGYTLFLTAREALLSLGPVRRGHCKPTTSVRACRGEPESVVLRMQLSGANPQARVTGEKQLPGRSNYFIGNNPAQWHTDIPTYGEVRYEGIYPGIDLVYHGDQGKLEYDLVVAPGADPGKIRLRFAFAHAFWPQSGQLYLLPGNWSRRRHPPGSRLPCAGVCWTGGADDLRVIKGGDLMHDTPWGQLRHHKPLVYQEINGSRREVAGRYRRLGKQQVGFEIAAYDHTRPLIIDPVLTYSTYLGGPNTDQGRGIAIDLHGNAYITGNTAGSFPVTANAAQLNFGGGPVDAFVTKLNAAGDSVVYSTYLGGSDFDEGNGIAVDVHSNAYVTGRTDSSDFPTTAHAVQPSFGGIGDAFVAKLNATGSSLVYSTYLGGSNVDIGAGIAVDVQGIAYVTGFTAGNFPTTLNAPQPTFGGGPIDAFVAKLNATGSSLVYSTYLGGSDGDNGSDIAVDVHGNAYVTGSTTSSDFPTTAHAVQPSFGGIEDAFLAKLNATGSSLVYSTYLGGSNVDLGIGIAVDLKGNAYVTGSTQGNFPASPNAAQPTFGGGFSDVFVAKLNAAGNSQVYSTYLGGSGVENAGDIAVDVHGNAYVTGSTGGSDFPTTTNAVQPSFGGIADAFVTKLNAAGNSLIYSTYLGGSNRDFGFGIAVDVLGNAYVTGLTDSGDFPITNAAQPTFGGVEDAFVTKISAR